MYTFYDSNGKSLMTFLASSGIANLITETGSPVPVPVPITPQIQIPVAPPVQVPITDPIPPPGYIPGSSNPSGNPSNTNLGIPFLVSEPIIPIIPVVISNPFDNNYGTIPVVGPATSPVPYVPAQPETTNQPSTIPVTPYIPSLPVSQPVIDPVQTNVQPSIPTLPLTPNTPVYVDSSRGSSESERN